MKIWFLAQRVSAQVLSGYYHFENFISMLVIFHLSYLTCFSEMESYWRQNQDNDMKNLIQLFFSTKFLRILSYFLSDNFYRAIFVLCEKCDFTFSLRKIKFSEFSSNLQLFSHQLIFTTTT